MVVVNKTFWNDSNTIIICSFSYNQYSRPLDDHWTRLARVYDDDDIIICLFIGLRRTNLQRLEPVSRVSVGAHQLRVYGNGSRTTVQLPRPVKSTSSPVLFTDIECFDYFHYAVVIVVDFPFRTCAGTLRQCRRCIYYYYYYYRRSISIHLPACSEHSSVSYVIIAS